MLRQDIETAGARIIIPDDKAAAGEVASASLDQMLQQSSREVSWGTSLGVFGAVQPLPSAVWTACCSYDCRGGDQLWHPPSSLQQPNFVKFRIDQWLSPLSSNDVIRRSWH